MKLKFLSLGAALFALLPFAHAEVSVFQPRTPSYSLGASLSLSTSAYRKTGNVIDVNRGTAAQEVLRFVNEQAAELGLNGGFTGESLIFKRLKKSPQGISLHFQQRFNRVTIEGAELIALFDINGNLTTLNSSLVQVVGFNVQPEISREDALRAAVRLLSYQQADLGAGARDGLLISPRPGRVGQYALVWQLSFREFEDGSRPVEVQVLARGAQKGSLLRQRSLEHSVSRAPVAIYDASVTAVIPNPIYKGVKVLQNGEPTLIGRVLPLAEARAANSQFEKVLDFYSDEFERNSFDGQGAEVVASVTVQKYTFLDILDQKQNAAWMAPWKLFIFGAGGEELGNFVSALDVVGHEYTHAVVSSSSDLIYEGEPGALNEHLADVFGAMIEQASGATGNPFLIGDSVLLAPLKKEAEALRDMLHPEKSLSPQPGKVSETPPEYGPGCMPSGGNDNCGVHILSGIPNRAFALMTEKLGWETLRGISYRVMTQRLRTTSDFRDYRAQFEDECKAALSRSMCRVVKQAFDAVEIVAD
jgi:Zn-dependent metalloprotease